MADPTETIETENVVASTSADQELNLDTLAADLEGVDFDPDRFPGLIYHLDAPKATALVFRSGEVVITGAKSEAKVHEALAKLFDEFGGLGVEVPDSPAATVQNIVSTADLGVTLNLNAIAIGLGLENVEYEPEQFPGLLYRLDEPGVVLLLFGSGKLVITGGERPVDADHAVDKIVSQLSSLGLLEGDGDRAK